MDSMYVSVQPPQAPINPEPIAPMIYVRESPVYQYKQVIRDLSTEQLLNEEELNKFGEQGWELAGVVTSGASAHFYFKRLIN
jgi:hypothetical protein